MNDEWDDLRKVNDDMQKLEKLPRPLTLAEKAALLELKRIARGIMGGGA
jgi:hypothetical protein